MSLRFLEVSEKVNQLLLQNHHPPKTLDEHRRCVESMATYLEVNSLDFSEDAIVPWLEEIKHRLSKDSVSRYRRSAYRILRFISTGSISYGICQSITVILSN